MSDKVKAVLMAALIVYALVTVIYVVATGGPDVAQVNTVP